MWEVWFVDGCVFGGRESALFGGILGGVLADVEVGPLRGTSKKGSGKSRSLRDDN